MQGAGHDGDASDLAISPDGKWVATASLDSTIIIWDMVDGVISRHWISHGYKMVICLTFSPDGRYLLSGGYDSKIKIWDLAEGSRLVATLEGHTGRVTECAWSPRGDIIASGSFGSTVRLWDARRAFHELHKLEHGDRNGIVGLLAFSADGCWLVSGSELGYRIWNVASGTLHQSFLHDRLNIIAVAFDPGSTRPLRVQQNAVELLDVETGEDLGILRGVAGAAWEVSFSLDGKVVCTASPSRNVHIPGAVKFWDAHTCEEPFSLEGHKTMVRLARFSPCGRYVASALDDGTVRLWRTGDGSCRATFSEHGTATVFRVAFSRDGETLRSMDIYGTVIMRRLCDAFPMMDE